MQQTYASDESYGKRPTSHYILVFFEPIRQLIGVGTVFDGTSPKGEGRMCDTYGRKR